MKTILISIPTSIDDVEIERQGSLNLYRATFADYEGFGKNKQIAFDDLLTNIPDSNKQTHFPNGFDAWYETHHVIVKHIAETEDDENTIAGMRLASQGMGGLWELGKELTDEWEKLHADRVWEDGTWLEELEQWLQLKEQA